jgi:hypothetical protein
MVMLSKKIRLLRGDLHALSLVMHALTTHALPAGQEKSKIRANVSLRAQLKPFTYSSSQPGCFVFGTPISDFFSFWIPV